MAINVPMLRSFAVVAETGNLSDAALRLGRTPSAVSMALKQFEEHLGAKLFESDRKNRLTVLGQEVFELAQRQLAHFDTTMRSIEMAARAPQGLVRIASVPSVANTSLPEAIAQLIECYPGLKIELEDSDTAGVIEALSSGRVDVGIASGVPKLNGVRQDILFKDALGLVCARNHPLAVQKRAPQARDLAVDRFVRNPLCDLIKSPDILAAMAVSKLDVHNTLSLIGMVRSGGWVTILPRTVAKIMPDHLVFRRIEGFDETRTVSLLSREQTRFPLVVAQLSEILRETVAA